MVARLGWEREEGGAEKVNRHNNVDEMDVGQRREAGPWCGLTGEDVWDALWASLYL